MRRLFRFLFTFAAAVSLVMSAFCWWASRKVLESSAREVYAISARWEAWAIAFLILPSVWVALWGVGPLRRAIRDQHRAWRSARRVRAGLRPRCGYDLRATPDRCPECGTPASRSRKGTRCYKLTRNQDGGNHRLGSAAGCSPPLRATLAQAATRRSPERHAR